MKADKCNYRPLKILLNEKLLTFRVADMSPAFLQRTYFMVKYDKVTLLLRKDVQCWKAIANIHLASSFLQLIIDEIAKVYAFSNSLQIVYLNAPVEIDNLTEEGLFEL